MTTQKVKITNGTGAPFRTIGGLYAIDESKYIDISELITTSYKLEKLETDIALNIIIEYNGTIVSATEIGKILDIVASHARAENRPVLDMLDVNGGGAVAATGGDITVVGRNLLRGQTFDELTLVEAPAGLKIVALTPGDSPFSVEMTAGAGALSVTLVANKLTIELAAGGSSDNAIATEINKDGGDCDGYLRAESISGGNFTLAQAETPLAGGIGNFYANKIMVGGLEALPANSTGVVAGAKWLDTAIRCTTQAVGVAGDVVNIEAEVNGLLVPPLSAVLV